MICAFTGHRPQGLPWVDREEDPRCLALKARISELVDQAIRQGCQTFLCGMARGCDTYFAEIVLEKKRQAPSIYLEAVLPCPEQADRWAEADRRRYGRLLERCDRITVLEASYTEGCMLRRNRAMVERADLLISVYDGGPGGTGSTVRHAKSLGIPVLPVWL